MNLPAALARLARAGITSEVLAAQHVDATDPTALRALVEGLLASVLAENAIACGLQVRHLQAALGALRTDAERNADNDVATRLLVDLRARRVLVDPSYPCNADVAYAA